MSIRWFHLVACGALFAAGLTGCSRYSAVSSYEQHQKHKQNFLDSVTDAGGKIELKNYAIAGKGGDAWNLNMVNAKVSDAVITLMEGTSYLAEANFAKSTLTDAQLLKLDELKLMQFTMMLDLSDTAITDESFSKLKNMRAVKSIKLKGSKVTKAGVETFRKAYLANPETIPIFKKPVIEL